MAASKSGAPDASSEEEMPPLFGPLVDGRPSQCRRAFRGQSGGSIGLTLEDVDQARREFFSDIPFQKNS